MSSRFALLLALTSTFVACSSESTNTPVGGGGSAGSAAGTGGGSGGTGAVGGTGGSAGSPSGGGTAGTAGSPSGGGTGNVSGSAGQDGGLGGAAGSGGMAGGGATGGALPATVYCGSSAPSCDTSPGRCCYETSANKPVCQLEAADCPAEANTRILCDGSEDCAAGQVCCKVSPGLVGVGGAPNKPSVYCSTDCTPPAFGSKTQVCDTKQTSPTQCLTGTCKKVVHTNPPNTGEAYDTSLPIGYGVCK